MEKILTADFSNGASQIRLRGIWQHDYGAKLKVKGIDYSNLIRVDFAGANDPKAYPVVAVQETDGTFTAKIPKEVTDQAYDINAYIYVSGNDAGYTVKEVVMPVRERVDADPASGGGTATDPYAAVIEKMTEYKNSAENSAKAAAAEVEKVTGKTEQIEQNTADVASLKEDVTELKDGKISKFYASSQGETNLPDSDAGRLVDLKLYGKSEQKQYSGKNILPSISIPKTTQQGITVESLSATEIKVTGTATDKCQIDTWGCNINVPKGANLLCKVLQGSKFGRSYVYLYATNYAQSVNAYFDKISTKSASEDFICSMIRIGVNAGESMDCVIGLSLQMDSSTSYEPYTGGIHSPNPEYPQEIKSVVNPVVKVMGKNLLSELNLSTITDFGITVSPAGQKKISVKGTATGEAYLDFWGQNFYVPKGAKLLCKILQGSGSNKNKIYFYSTGFTGTLNANFGEVSSIYVSSGYQCDMVRVYIPSGESVDCILGLSLQMDTSTNYEPYTESTATLPYTLNAIPVSSGGNVTIDGQQYIADYVDVERGKLVRMVSPVAVYDSGYVSGNNNSHQVQINKYIKNTTDDKIGIILCDKLRPASANDVWNGAADNIVSVHSTESNKLTFRCTAKANDMDSALKFIESCKIYIALAEPEEIDLTSEEITIFKALATYYPVTNISINSEQLDGYTVFNYPISMENGWNYVKKQLNDNRDYIYDMDLQSAEAYVNSEYAVALTELEV